MRRCGPGVAAVHPCKGVLRRPSCVTPSRYHASGPEAEFEPGSRSRVLRNLLGIRLVRDMNLAESQALEIAQVDALERFTSAHRFSAQDYEAFRKASDQVDDEWVKEITGKGFDGKQLLEGAKGLIQKYSTK